jgi:arylsulfatase A
MSGQYSFRNYGKWASLENVSTTFADVLKDAGYRTAIAGKWQFGDYPDTSRSILEAGFQEHCCWNRSAEGRNPSIYWEPGVWQNGKELTDVDQWYGPDIFSSFISDFIRENKDTPFFAYYSMTLVHRPFDPPPQHGERPDSPGTEDVRNFPAMVSYLDELVGKVVQTLDSSGLRENTLVIFTSDNGSPNVKGLKSSHQGKMIPGGKGSPADLGVRVPTIFSWPGVIPEGKSSPEIMDFTDFFPTILASAGARLPSNLTIDGFNMLPVLTGESESQRQWIYTWGVFEETSETYKEPAKHAVLHIIRNRRWKLYSDGRLFDMEADPFETSPVNPEAPPASSAFTFLQSELKKLRTSEPRLW